jgi:hypothetical protein
MGKTTVIFWISNTYGQDFEETDQDGQEDKTVSSRGECALSTTNWRPTRAEREHDKDDVPSCRILIVGNSSRQQTAYTITEYFTLT